MDRRASLSRICGELLLRLRPDIFHQRLDVVMAQLVLVGGHLALAFRDRVKKLGVGLFLYSPSGDRES